MPARSPQLTVNIEKNIHELGRMLRDRRKKLGVSAIATAEASGMSRITLYRIERGEASVTMGAYVSVIFALGLELALSDRPSNKRKNNSALQEVPQKIRLTDYKQLKRLAWQIKGNKEISPKEALDLYERNWRHVDTKAMDPGEQRFLNALLAMFGRERLLV